MSLFFSSATISLHIHVAANVQLWCCLTHDLTVAANYIILKNNSFILKTNSAGSPWMSHLTLSPWTQVDLGTSTMTITITVTRVNTTVIIIDMLREPPMRATWQEQWQCQLLSLWLSFSKISFIIANWAITWQTRECWINVGLMLGHRLTACDSCPNMTPALVWRLVSAGIHVVRNVWGYVKLTSAKPKVFLKHPPQGVEKN